MSVARQYTDELFDQLGYWATWLPTAPISLGDCGTVSERIFQPEGTLRDFDIDYGVADGDAPLDVDYQSNSGVQHRFQVAGGIRLIPQIPEGKAGIEISFGRDRGVVVILRGGVQSRIRDLHRLRGDMLDSVSFPRDYAVVTEVVRAETATILISSGGGGRFVATAEVGGPVGLADLANASAGFTRITAEKMALELVARRDLVPLFKLWGFKKKGLFLGSPRVGALGFEPATPDDIAEVEPVETDAEEGWHEPGDDG